jgi:hypothetical protein
MKLLRLSLRNFKVIKELDLEPQGHDLFLFGRNEAGKTTVFDGYSFLLAGTDSLGRSDFGIKTRENGVPVSKVNHEVEGEFEVGTTRVTLRKVYREVWSKKRGSPTDSFTGHTTDHFVNGVPVQKQEFDRRVADIAAESTFRLLTNPACFTGLHWREQRGHLVKLAGDISDAEVIASSADLSLLPDILGERSLEEHKRIIQARRTQINKELPSIATRIDEVSRSMPDLPDAKRKELEAELAQLQEARTGKELERARVEAGGEVAERRKRISEIQGALLDVANKVRGAIDKRIQEVRQNTNTLQSQADAKAREVRQYEGQFADAKTEIGRLSDLREQLRVEWREVDARAFDRPHQAENCAVCGQPLPKEQIAEAHQRAEEEFNKVKARALETVNEQGQKHKGRQERLEHQVADLEEAIARAKAEHDELEKKAKDAAAELERLQSKVPDVSKNPEHQKLVAEQAEVEASIQSLEADTATTISGINETIAGIDQQIAAVQRDMARYEERERDEARIVDLNKQEKLLTGEYEKLTRELFLVDLFTRKQAELLTDRINTQFEFTTFQLFEEQVNGGLADTCQAIRTYDGVPFHDLNNAGRVQVGLDIIRTLQRHYGIFPPVWVDGRESVTDIPDMPCQVISLVVSPKDKALRVEITPKGEEVAA